jgi:glutathione S-transferase
VTHRLITIRFSHYCEKARWALDRYGVGYDEEGHLPGFHLPAVRQVARGEPDKASSPYSTPVLITDESDVLSDSRAIVRWASDRFGGGELYPTEAVDRWEQRFHDRLGIHSRQMAYAFLFQAPSMLAELGRRNVGGLEGRAFALATPLMVGRLRRRMNIGDDALERSVKVIDEELGVVDDALSDGRAFLVHDRFTAADLAFACAAAPALIIQPEEGYGAVLPRLEELPAPLAQLVEKWRARPAGRYALKLFRAERGQRVRPYRG